MYPVAMQPVAPSAISKPDKPQPRQAFGMSDNTNNGVKKDPTTRARGVSLTMLIKEKILEPGSQVLSIEYLGEKYVADLLETGKICWQGVQFASPSSWAIYVKKQIDPSKKSGCGWNSVKYRGKKLDFYKSIYNKKTKPAPVVQQPVQQNHETPSQQSFLPQCPIKHSKLKDFSADIHPNTMVECDDFDQNAGKLQPFHVTISTNCLLLINFHCHLTQGEVVGYLGGKWDQEKQCLIILQAFPCKCKLGDRQNATVTEEQIRLGLQRCGLFKVGWYHSHPTSVPEPTLRDIDCQMQYQVKFSANNPMLGLICSPSHEEEGQFTDSSMTAFWVAPSLEPSTTPNSCFGMPMRFSYSELQDNTISPDLQQELIWLVDYYAVSPDLINFSRQWRGNTSYLDRLKHAVFSKLPKDGNASIVMQLLQKLITYQ